MRRRIGTTRHLLAGFPFLLLLLAAAFAWLSWRLMAQDRALEQERARDLLETTADRIQAGLQSSLAGLKSQAGLLLTGLPPSNEIPDNVVLLLADASTLKSYPEQRLLYCPDQTPVPELTMEVFRAGENLEYISKNPRAAAQVYRRLTGSRDVRISAGAWLRLVRALRAAGSYDEALASCAALERLDPLDVASLPAGLRARQFRCRILEQAGKLEERDREAMALRQDLLGGRWRLPRAAFELALDESRPHSNNAELLDPSPEDLALAAAVEELWNGRTDEKPEGQRFAAMADQPVLLIWLAREDKLAAAVAGPRYLHGLLPSVPQGSMLQAGLADAEGRLLLGAFDAGAPVQVVRTAVATRMPWSVHVSGAGSQDEGYASRRGLLLAGIALMTVTLLGGAYLSWRAVLKELAVARLQADFVSAVSHEFRSPLTAIRQISELLVGDRVPSEDYRSRFYNTLSRESRRLHWLVENLLDFGSIEAGAAHYTFEKLDLSALTHALVDEFRAQIGDQGHLIQLSTASEGPVVRADREALGRALWNLLDNAVKYSPHSPRILVATALIDGARAALKVQDFGLGIAPSEQREIFKKFVRGAAAQAHAIKGTGLGLAMVEHIVRAHGGKVELQSEPGRGSTFVILLPIEKNP